MNLHISFYICVALLFPFRSAQDGDDNTLFKHSCDVDKLAEKRRLINGIFKPSKRGFLGNGSFAFTYEGILLPINKTIAMKFTKTEKKTLSAAEYEMYTYLHAINSSEVERFGIPAVYYYGEWIGHDLIMMGLTLLDREVYSLEEFLQNEVNVLIVLRDFILTSKYVHSCNIRHDDVKLGNMMISKSKTFLIDFNVSRKLNVKSSSGTRPFKSRRAYKNGHRYPKDDWESFLYSMCTHLNVKFHWVGIKDSKKILSLIEDTTQTIERIKTIRSEILRNIFVSLAVHIFNDGGEFESYCIGYSGNNSFYHSNVNVEDRFPDYDFYYKFVNDKIREFNLTEPVMFSWLDKSARDDAIDDLIEHPIPDITKIKKPTNQNYISFNYPAIDEEYFTRTYKDWKPRVPKKMTSSSSKSAGNSSGKKARVD